MVNFFEKLKRGMGAEGAPAEEIENKVKEEEPASAESDSPKRGKETKKPKVKKGKAEEKNIEVKSEEGEEEASASVKTPADKSEGKEKAAWSQIAQTGEGQLAIDVYQTQDFLVIQSAIAGVKPESLDVVIEGDMVTIKGTREKPEEDAEKNYFNQECFWGPFSRQIVLSVEVDPGRTEASLKDGILTVRVPKIERERKRKIEVRG